jgi:hypothetical protein
MKRKLIFLMVAVLLLSPWPVTYAYGNSTTGQSDMHVEAAATEAAPKWKAFGNAIGGVTPGDLFYINTGDTATDMPVTLLITNTNELIHHYRYLNLSVAVYVQTDTDQWEKLTTSSGEPLPDTYITMSNGKANFTLPGYARYKITIDKGCFYCYGNTGKGAVAPTFYLSVG